MLFRKPLLQKKLRGRYQVVKRLKFTWLSREMKCISFCPSTSLLTNTHASLFCGIVKVETEFHLVGQRNGGGGNRKTFRDRQSPAAGALARSANPSFRRALRRRADDHDRARRRSIPPDDYAQRPPDPAEIRRA